MCLLANKGIYRHNTILTGLLLVSSLLAVLILPSPLFAQAMPSSSSVSSGHGKILFSSDRDGNWDIYTMNVDGSNIVNLTHNPAEDQGPVWSPDGTKIAFVSKRDGREDIFVMN